MKNKEYILNPINYCGSKDRILPLLLQHIPQGINNIVELFSGCGVFSLNSGIKNIFLNDKNTYLYNLIRTIKEFDTEKIFELINVDVDFFDLNKNNKEGFLNLRNEFNKRMYQHLNDQDKNLRGYANIELLTLIYHSFNYFITFNKDGKYVNTSGCGRSWFNLSLQKKLRIYSEALKDNSKSIQLYNKDFIEFFNMYYASMGGDLSDTLFFVDPPYTNSDDIYSRTTNLKWSSDNEHDLHHCLDNITLKGGRWIYTNMLQKGENINQQLKNFADRYNCQNTQVDFGNCNYQKKDKIKNIEILIKNF